MAMRRSRMPKRAISKRAGPSCAANPPTWWNNAQGLTPCDVYQSIMDKCGYIAPTLTGNDSYYPVSLAQACMCNTIAYNLGSACQDCQRGTTDQGVLVSLYETGGDGCPTMSTDLPEAVTPADNIPEWAFLDTSTQFWTYLAAEQIAQNSTTTTSATAAPTVSFTDITTMDLTATFTFSGTPTSSSSPTEIPAPSSSKSTNAGAIGGGVAGGVVFMLLVIGLLLFLRRRRARNSPSNVVMGTVVGGRNASTSSESSLTESKMAGSSSHYTPHSQMTQLNHNGSGVNIPTYSTSTASALTTPVDAPAIPPIPREYMTPTPARSLTASPTPSAPAAPPVKKVKRVPVRYSEDELAQAEEEARRTAQHQS